MSELSLFDTLLSERLDLSLLSEEEEELERPLDFLEDFLWCFLDEVLDLW